MKKPLMTLVLFSSVIASIAFSILAFPALSFSEVRISLKNGRSIIAESCRESKDMLTCEKMGGSFEIDKRDVLDTKSINVENHPFGEVSEERKGQGTETGKSEADTKGTEKQPGGDLVRGLRPEERERLGQINQRKLEMKDERERLIMERDNLNDEIRKTGQVMTQAQYDEIKKRVAELETRISTFNEDVRKLNEEEQTLGSRK